jgi:zinc protease
MPVSNLRATRVIIGVSLGVSVWLSSAAASDHVRTAASVTQSQRALKANPPVSFAQSASDLPADPAVRFGKLPNGMTFVIYKNKTPPGAASVWLRVAAGSVMEQENQRGLAHFIEHMAFNGSKNVPEGEMIKLLQRDGLRFGADTNAQTTSFQTVYMLNLPEATDRIVSNALFLMRETAGNISFQQSAIDRERGVILGEERARATVSYRAYEANLKHLFPGTKYVERMPIGSVDVIKTAKRREFVRFYNDFYRPEYTTLIVVGDVDVARVEADIRGRFSNWRPGPKSGAALTDFGRLADRPLPQAATYSAAGLQDLISVSWVKPPQGGVETRASNFSDKLFSIGSAILDERFARRANSADAKFLGAGFQKEDIEHTASTYSLIVAPKEGHDQAALDQAVAILREFLSNGPSEAELDRAVASFDRRYVEGAAAARTVPTQALAGLIVQSLASGGVVQSPEQALAQWNELKPAITRSAIRDLLNTIASDRSPVLWRQGEEESFDDKALLAAWNAASAENIKVTAERASSSWPYGDFGTPAKVVSREALSAAGATRVTFSNGAVLTVKQTDFQANSVNISVQTGNGLRGVLADQAAALFVAQQIGPLDWGLGKISSDDMRDALAGKIYSLGMAIGPDATMLSGTTTTADLTTQLQIAAAFLSDPGFRPEALDRFMSALPAIYKDGRTSPDGVYAIEAAGDLYDDDPRFAVPSLRDVLAVSKDQVSSLLRQQLGGGPLEVTIVGDVDIDDAIRQVAATIGALPSLPRRQNAPGGDELRFPTANLHRVYTHDGRADQNLSVVAWPTTDGRDTREASTLELLSSVMTLRLLEQVREKQGASYSASASSFASRYFPYFGYIISRASVRPEIDSDYYRTVSVIADALKARPVTADELNRARRPLLDRLRNDRHGNGYWLALLSGSVRTPDQIASIEARERNLLAITPEDIQAAAKVFLDMSKALRIQVKPK